MTRMDRVIALKRIVLPALLCAALTAWAGTLNERASMPAEELATKLEIRGPQVSPGQSATQLSDGSWLLAGGNSGAGQVTGRLILLDRSFAKPQTLTARLATARSGHTATVLADGNVLIAGGVNATGQPVAAIELFHPQTRQLEVVGDVGLEARSQHTATVLMDGRVLIAGGIDVSSLVRRDAQLLDPRTWRVESIARLMSTERFAHLAALLPSDDVVLWSGKDQSNDVVISAELYNRSTAQFARLEDSNSRSLLSQPYSDIPPTVKGSLPLSKATGVSLDAQLSVRFSKPLAPQTLDQSSVTLLGPGGAVEAQVVAAEGGLLLFVTPKNQLLPGTQYTLFVKGAKDSQERALPFTAIGFETRAVVVPPRRTAPPDLIPNQDDTVSDDDELWIPRAGNLSGLWRSGNGRKMPSQLPAQALVAKAIYGRQVKHKRPRPPVGQTALAGQVLKLNAKPLANVTLSIGTQRTTTDSNGEFLLDNVPAGFQTLVIDGGTASSGKRQYGRYEYRALIEADKTNALPFVIWMSRLDTRHEVNIPAPTSSEYVLTNPRIPGLELHIPPGTVIRDAQGRVVTQLTMTAIPVDQPPFPLPTSFVPVYFTIQPGGAHLQGLTVSAAKGARLIYPNFSNAPAGARMDFWNYDSREKGWYVYGQGTVSEDRKQIVPDEGVVIYEFSGAMISLPNEAPAEGPPPDDDSCESGPSGPADSGQQQAGDPVDCYTGLFLHERIDLSIRDVIPLQVLRTYRPRDSASRSFGIGTTLSYDMFLVGDNTPYTYQDLILPDGGRVHYSRISPGSSWADAVYKNTSAPGRFFGSTIRWNPIAAGGWLLELVDGSLFTFPEAPALSARCGTPLEYRDRRGNTLTFTRGTNCRLNTVTSPSGRHLNFTYDGSNRVTAVTDDIGRTVTYGYDTSGRLTLVTYPDNKTEAYTYDTQHRMLTVTDGRGNVMVTNTYDTNGRVSQQTYADNTTSGFSYTLNGSNKVTQMDYTDERGFIKRVQFNSSGFTTSITRAVGQTAEQTLSFTRNATSNLVESQTDPLGRMTTYQYNNGKVTQITYLAGTGNATTWTYTHEPNFGLLASATDPLNHTTTYNYDSTGNLTSVVDTLNHTTSYTYTASGFLSTATRTLGSSPLTTTYTYNGPDIAGIEDPLGRTTQFFTDAVGRVRSVKDPLGNLTRFAYDSRDRLTETTDRLGNSVHYTYDGSGNLEIFEDARNNSTEFTYDTRNRVITKTDPLNEVESYGYDETGNVTRVTDRKGQVTGYGYDSLNRMTNAGFGATLSNPTSFTSTVAYTWDAGNRLTDAVDSVSGTVSRDFDGLDRLTEEVTPQGQINYAYYANGLRQTMTVQGQSGVSYSYDNANRLTQIAQGSATVGLTYDTLNRRSTLTLPNGIEVTYGYDDASQLTSLTYQKASTTLGDLTYTYDVAGRRIGVGGSFARVTLPAAVTSSVHNASNRVTTWGTHVLDYDDNGALVSDADATTLTYVWDERERLREIKQGATTTASFQYDTLNRRTSKTVGGATTHFLHDGWQIVQEQNGTTPTVNLLTGLRTDEIFRRTTSTTVENFLTDALGSTVALADASGTIQTTYTYEPYGATTASGPVGGRYEYTGRENDGDLYYYRNRYYSPNLRRFVSEDPIGFAGGSNLYAYAGGNPVQLNDPFGLDPEADQVPGYPVSCPSIFAPFTDGTPENQQLLAAGNQFINEVTTWYIQSLLEQFIYLSEKPDREQKPEGTPAGTKPINKDKRLDREEIHKIKDQLRAGAKDWVGIDPNGNIWTSEGGSPVDNGHYSDYLD